MLADKKKILKVCGSTQAQSQVIEQRCQSQSVSDHLLPNWPAHPSRVEVSHYGGLCLGRKATEFNQVQVPPVVSHLLRVDVLAGECRLVMVDMSLGQIKS